jgi:toxin YoeB
MRSKLVWTNAAWEDYVYWQSQDKKTLKRINQLLKEVMRDPEVGIGKPEPLRENLAGFWSRRIDDSHRLVYAIEKDQIIVIACRYHYE